MVVLTASKARENLFPLLAAVNADSSVVHITSKAGDGVLMSATDFDAWQTTLYLFASPANAKRLHRSFAAARRGEFRTVDQAILDDDE